MKLTFEELESKELQPDTLRLCTDQIRMNGYIVLENVLPPSKIQPLHETFMKLFEQHFAVNKVNNGPNRTMMYLPFAEPFIDPDIVAHPFVLAIMDELLGKDYVCRYMASDTPLPGSDYQNVHADLGALFPESAITLPPALMVVNIPLVDFRTDNGPMEIWPGGTHLMPENANRPEFIQQMSAHMHSESVLMPAGSLLIRDLRMWHRGTPNQSDAARPNLAFIYARPWYSMARKIPVSRELYATLDPKLQALFRLEDIG